MTSDLSGLHLHLHMTLNLPPSHLSWGHQPLGLMVSVAPRPFAYLQDLISKWGGHPVQIVHGWPGRGSAHCVMCKDRKPTEQQPRRSALQLREQDTPVDREGRASHRHPVSVSDSRALLPAVKL